jgi:hypothetical protein
LGRSRQSRSAAIRSSSDLEQRLPRRNRRAPSPGRSGQPSRRNRIPLGCRPCRSARIGGSAARPRCSPCARRVGGSTGRAGTGPWRSPFPPLEGTPACSEATRVFVIARDASRSWARHLPGAESGRRPGAAEPAADAVDVIELPVPVLDEQTEMFSWDTANYFSARAPGIPPSCSGPPLPRAGPVAVRGAVSWG